MANRISFSFLAGIVALSLSVVPAWAQFTKGQTVYFNYVGEPREGRVIKQDSSGVMLELRNAMNGQYDGSTTMYRPASDLTTTAPANFNPAGYGNANGALQPTGGGVLPAATPGQSQWQQPTQPAYTPAQPAVTQYTQPAAQPTAGGSVTGSGVMSQDDVLGFLRARLGAQPFSVPWDTRVKAYDDLLATIKARGVNFRYEAVGKFSDELYKFGIPSSITSAIRNNFGTPISANWYVGTWHMDQHGAPTAYMKGGEVWEKQYFGKSGSLTIQANGKYMWNSASGPISGTWRAAGPADFKGIDKGGAGIVLTKAKTGTDWIVYEDDKSPGQSIVVSEVGWPDHQEVGGRGR